MTTRPKTKVFLAGPMRGIPREQGLAWRTQAQKLLGDGCEVRHAYRGREKRETMPDGRLAVARDLRDIAWADVLLVNDTFADASMIGTAMEVQAAFSRGVPVILFGDAHQGDYFLEARSHARVGTLPDACAAVRNFFTA